MCYVYVALCMGNTLYVHLLHVGPILIILALCKQPLSIYCMMSFGINLQNPISLLRLLIMCLILLQCMSLVKAGARAMGVLLIGSSLHTSISFPMCIRWETHERRKGRIILESYSLSGNETEPGPRLSTK